MLYSYNNFYSVRRNLSFVNLLLLLSLLSADNITIINLYLFKIDLNKVSLGLNDVLFIITLYFFMIYFSFLYNNENNTLEDLIKSKSFRTLRNTKSKIKKFFYLPFLIPFLVIFDGFKIKNFLIVISPYILTFINIFFYLYETIPTIYKSFLVFVFMILIQFFNISIILLDHKYNEIRKKYINDNFTNNLKEKYKINKKRESK